MARFNSNEIRKINEKHGLPGDVHRNHSPPGKITDDTQAALNWLFEAFAASTQWRLEESDAVAALEKRVQALERRIETVCRTGERKGTGGSREGR